MNRGKNRLCQIADSGPVIKFLTHDLPGAVLGGSGGGGVGGFWMRGLFLLLLFQHLHSQD